MTDAWPFAGREALLARCGSLIGSPRAHALVLVGDMGIGKTTLLAECCRRAEDAGFAVLRATGHRSSAAIPFGALALLLPPGTEMVTSGVPLLRQVGDALAADASGRPILMAVDDAHLLDDASAVLLHQLAAARRVFVMVTVRREGASPDAVDGLWRGGLGERVDVPPLTADDIGAVLAAVLDGAVESALRDALTRSSDGNPLVLRELVRGSLAAGSLVEERGLWRLRGALVPSVSLHELHAARLLGLDESRRRSLDVIAIGEPIGLLDAEALGAVSIETLEDEGFVVAAASQRRTVVRVADPSFGDVLRVGVPMLRGRAIRRAIAERVLAAGARRRGDVLQVAVLLDEAGEHAPRPILAAAAHEAFAAHDFVTAERLALQAEAIEHGVETAQVLAAARYRAGRSAGGAPSFSHAPSAGERSDRERALGAMNQAAVQYWHEGDPDAADATLAGAAEALGRGAWAAELVAMRANLDVNAGSPGVALARLADLGDVSGRTLAMASLVRSLALPHVGRAADGVGAVEAGRRAHAGLEDRLELFQVSLLVSTESTALFELGDLPQAVAVALDGYRSSSAERDTAGQAFSALVLGRALVARGKATSALRWFREAQVLFDSIGHRGPARWARGGIALAAALRGDVAAGVAALRHLDEGRDHPAHMLETDVERARAWVAVGGGDPVNGRALLRAAAEACRERSLHALETVVLHDLARLGGARDVRDRIEDVTAGVQGAWLPALAADVSAMAQRDAHALASSSEELARIGADLLAAEASMRAAAAHASAGRQRDAVASRRRAVELLANCEGARTPGVADSDGPVPLTDREREIAVLAASGLTSKAISARLILSVRTIDNNLARVYDKLGIADRSGIGAALGLA